MRRFGRVHRPQWQQDALPAVAPVLRLRVPAPEFAYDQPIDVAVVDGVLVLRAREQRSLSTPYGAVESVVEARVDLPHDVHLPAGLDPATISVERHGGQVDIRLPLRVLHSQVALAS